MPRVAAAALLTALLVSSTTTFPAAAIVITSRSRSIQPGELVILTLTTAVRAEAIQVRVFERDAPTFRVDDLTWKALVGIDLDVRPGTYPVMVDGRSGAERLEGSERLVIRTKRFPTRVLTVDPAFVNPPPEQEARIVREAAELEQLWQHSSSARLWNAPFAAPVRAAANSAFGSRSIFNGAPRNPHAGADFPSAAGTPIASPNAGRVVLARDLYFSGNTVVLDHGLGLFSLLAHLSVIDVHQGDLVTPRQLIGKVGATGRVTGPHLHWAVRLNGARIDPGAVLALLGASAF